MATDTANPFSEAAAPRAAAGPMGTQTGLIMIALAGIAAMGTFATVFTVWYRTTPPGPQDVLRIALDEYVAGRYAVAQQLSEQVNPREDKEPEQYRIREFLRGASGIQLALRADDSQKMRVQAARSAPHLQRLAILEFPPGRTAEGYRLLGLGLQACGRFDEAIRPLEQAIAEDPTNARRLLLNLAESRLRASVPRMESALEDISRFLDLPNLSDTARDDALVLRARVLGKLGRYDEGLRILEGIEDEQRRDQIGVQTAQLLIDEARSLIGSPVPGDLAPGEAARGDAASENIPPRAQAALAEAVNLLEEVFHRNEVEYGGAALYLMGIAYRLAGEHEDALGILASLRQSVSQPAEAVAAGIEEVELLCDKGQFDDAVLAASAIVRDIREPVMFDPQWLSLADFRSRLESVAEQMCEGGGFAEAIALAQSLPPIVPEADALLIEARSHRRWGDATLKSLADRDSRSAAEARAEAREHFRNAGRAFEAVAQLRFDQADYIDRLWDAIDSYQSGRAFAESLELLDDYLRYENRSRIPRGLIARGRSLLAVGKPAEALEPLEDCIAEHPRDPLRYEARLLAAIAHTELGKLKEPRRRLEENLFDGRLSPDSPLFRDSLFVLGELLYRRAHRDHLELTAPTLAGGRISEGDQPTPEIAARFNENQKLLEDAISTLEEAAYRDAQFGNTTRTRRAAYLAAEAHHLAAYWPAVEASNPETLESARRQLNQKRMAHLVASRDGFTALRKQLLADVGKRDELDPIEHGMVRNCFMGVADTLFEMGDIESAAAAYQQASQEFLNEPLALEALLRQARCYNQLGREKDASRIYNQAAKVLERIPEGEDSRFARMTRYDRGDWKSLIDWLQQT